MNKLSPETKSFIILFGVAALGVYFSLWLTGIFDFNPFQKVGNGLMGMDQYSVNFPARRTLKTPSANAAPAENPVDTSTWKTYSDKTYNFSFKYKPEWKILKPMQKADFYILQVDPGKKFYNIKIYISPTEYLGVDSLPTVPDTVGGLEAINVENLLYGVKNDPYYYTFDIGLSLKLKNDFNALVRSVSFQS